MDNLYRIRYVTKNFGALQGLKMVPFGLFFLAMGVGWLGEQGDLSLSLPAFALTLLAYWLIGRYYTRSFGLVNSGRENFVKDFLLPLTLVLVLWLAAAVDYWVRLPVSIFGLTLAAVILVWWWLQEQRTRVHYAMMAGLIALISLLPLMGIKEGWSIIQPPGTLFHLLLGLIFVIGGILDHLLLMNNLDSRRSA